MCPARWGWIRIPIVMKPENLETNPPPDNKDQEKQPPGKKQANNYMKYSGMGIQMGIIILLGTLAGKKLDEYFGIESQLLTIVLALLSIFAALYLSLKDLIKGK